MDSKHCRPILKKVKNVNYNNPSLNSAGMGGVFFDGRPPSLLRDELRYNQYPEVLEQQVKKVEHERAMQQRQSRESSTKEQAKERVVSNYRPNQMTTPTPITREPTPQPDYDYQPLQHKRELAPKVTSSQGGVDVGLNREYNFNGPRAIRHKQMVGYNIISNM